MMHEQWDYNVVGSNLNAKNIAVVSLRTWRLFQELVLVKHVDVSAVEIFINKHHQRQFRRFFYVQLWSHWEMRERM